MAILRHHHSIAAATNRRCYKIGLIYSLKCSASVFGNVDKIAVSCFECCRKSDSMPIRFNGVCVCALDSPLFPLYFHWAILLCAVWSIMIGNKESLPSSSLSMFRNLYRMFGFCDSSKNDFIYGRFSGAPHFYVDCVYPNELLYLLNFSMSIDFFFLAFFFIK